MATFYREVTYRTDGEEARVAWLDRLDALPDLRVLLETHRELGVMERNRLFGTEHANHVVLEIAVDAELEDFSADANSADPYRTQDLEVIRRLRPDLGDLLHHLGASQRVITEGIVSFETRRYEKQLCEQIAGELRRRCDEKHLDAKLSIEDGTGGSNLLGRIRGSILQLEPIAHDLRTGGYVPFGRTVVKYL